MFEKTLNDLIRGLRANKNNEARYISQAISECRREVKSQELDVKAQAVLKLTYLEMFGFDLAWASFHIVEVMASPRYPHKVIGYLAACQSFRHDTDILMLTTNLIKKDLSSSNYLESALAINGIAHIVTPGLARDLTDDMLPMMSHSRPYIRKRAILGFYKVVLQYPDALELFVGELQGKLNDPDPSVVSATVNVICELARKSPRKYLPFAPVLFGLLTTSSNNWMLIKLIKLFTVLLPLEPRLVKKLVPPLTFLIKSTQAMSLLHECIKCVITGGLLTGHASSESLSQLCVAKLRFFFEETDQNLKYVGLLAMENIVTVHPDLVAQLDDVVLECLTDPDISIRLRALDLSVGMANKENFPEIVRKLMLQLVPQSKLVLSEQYKSNVIYRIQEMASANNYSAVENFEWYMAVLVDLVRISRVDVSDVLAFEIRNVCVRVRPVQPYAVALLSNFMCDIAFLTSTSFVNKATCESIVWTLGEYAELLSDPWTILDVLSNGALIKHINQEPYTLACLQAIPKVFWQWLKLDTWTTQKKASVSIWCRRLVDFADRLTRASNFEVQTRACELHQIISYVEAEAAKSKPLDGQTGSDDYEDDDDDPAYVYGNVPASLEAQLSHLYGGVKLRPVAPAAQSMTLVPEHLDLNAWIHAPPTPPPSLKREENLSLLARGDYLAVPAVRQDEMDPGESKALRERQRAARRERMKDDPFYLDAQSPPPASTKSLDIDAIPIVELELEDAESPGPGPGALSANLPHTIPHIVRRKAKKSSRREPVAPPEILGDEMPHRPDAKEPSPSPDALSISGFVKRDKEPRNIFQSRVATPTTEDDAPAAAPPAAPPAAPEEAAKPKKKKIVVKRRRQRADVAAGSA